MGCGQSKIGIYQRKSKSKKNGSKRSEENGENEEETEEGDATNAEIKISSVNDKGEEELESATSKVKQMAQQQTGGAVLAQSDISSSQVDFFKMLDEKIENGPDYEESDEEEQKARMTNLLQEWKAACSARQQKKSEPQDKEKWPSPSLTGKLYQEEYESYPVRRINAVDTQRFPTGYSSCPPNASISMHLQNTFRANLQSYPDQPRLHPRLSNMTNYNPFQPPSESYNHCDDSEGHPLTTNEPPNPLCTNYSQVLLRQSSITSEFPHYPENQRLYTDSIRQFSDYSRMYPDQRPYQPPRTMPVVNVLHESRIYGQDINSGTYPVYGNEPTQNEDYQRMLVDVSRPYHDPQRSEMIRPTLGSIEKQRLYHERLLEKQRQYGDGLRLLEGSRPPAPYQRQTLLTQRSMQDSGRIYRNLENEEHIYPRQDRFSDSTQEGPAGRIINPNQVKIGRSLSTEGQYVAGPPPPREVIPLQGAPGPPQGSPRPLIVKGLQSNIHRLPSNSVVHFRKPQDAFT